MTDIDNTQDILAVRDIITRFEELEAECADKQDAICKASDSNREKLKLLTALLENIEGNGGDEQWQGDWYPLTLIRDSYFETAMDELLEDIGDLPKNLPCYLKIEIDYKALQMDYSSVEFDGVTYWYR